MGNMGKGAPATAGLPRVGGPETAVRAPELRRGMRPREIVWNPVNLVPIPVLGVLALARAHDAIAAKFPLLLILGALIGVQAVTTVFALLFPPGSDRELPHLQVAVQIALIGVLVYMIGWGALLGIGFVFAAAGQVSTAGSRVGRTAIASTLLTVAAGEGAVQLGWAPTMVSRNLGHGLAALECAGLSAVIWLLTYSQRQKEQIETSLRRSEERFRTLVQHTSDAIVVLDADAVVTYASPAVEHLLGYAPSRFDKSWIEPDHLERVRTMFARVIAQPGEVGWIELPLRYGSTIVLSVSGPVTHGGITIKTLNSTGHHH